MFQPDTPDRNGTTTFHYRLVSNGITSATVAVTLTVRPVNDTPTPGNDSYLTDENVQVTVSAPGLLGNDTDVDGTTLQAQPQTPPSHGEVVIQPNGAFSYVPAVNYRGIDTFQYRAVDEQGGATTATATVIVTQPPTATNDVYLVDQDTPLIISEEEDGLVANDHDAPNAQYNLGVLYHQGLGVQKDTAKAIELYRVAASSNHPEALYNLAIAYVEGVGVEYNPQIAASYFERSADGGVVEAAYNLGLLHENGLLGESQPDEAVIWYKIAADKGNKEAVQSLAELKKKLS